MAFAQLHVKVRFAVPYFIQTFLCTLFVGMHDRGETWMVIYSIYCRWSCYEGGVQPSTRGRLWLSKKDHKAANFSTPDSAIICSDKNSGHRIFRQNSWPPSTIFFSINWIFVNNRKAHIMCWGISKYYKATKYILEFTYKGFFPIEEMSVYCVYMLKAFAQNLVTNNTDGNILFLDR